MTRLGLGVITSLPSSILVGRKSPCYPNTSRPHWSQHPVRASRIRHFNAFVIVYFSCFGSQFCCLLAPVFLGVSLDFLLCWSVFCHHWLTRTCATLRSKSEINQCRGDPCNPGSLSQHSNTVLVLLILDNASCFKPLPFVVLAPIIDNGLV
jgi:hypothetical protein